MTPLRPAFAAPRDLTNAVATGLWPVTSGLLFTPEKRPTGPWLHPFSNEAFSIRHHGEAIITFGEIQVLMNSKLLRKNAAVSPCCSSLPSRLYLDHSHCPVLAPATLARCRLPARFLIATCSMSLIPSAPLAHALSASLLSTVANHYVTNTLIALSKPGYTC